MKTENKVDARFRMPEAMWNRIEGMLPKFDRSPKGGRPRVERCQVLDAIFYVLRTGCQWKALPPEFGSGSTAHRYFQLLVEQGVFHDLWIAALEEYDDLKGIDWKWQSMDGAMAKAPLVGEKTDPNPSDRAKSGTKRSLLTEGSGMPIGLAVSGANTNDQRLDEETLDSRPLAPPAGEVILQHMCMDKGYDARDVRRTVIECGYEPHIPVRGQKPKPVHKGLRYRAHRWVCERTHSWMNRFRRILTAGRRKSPTTKPCFTLLVRISATQRLRF